MVEVKYFYKDEFGQETETKKTYTEDVFIDIDTIDILVNDFKKHLELIGFTDNIINEALMSEAED